MARRRYVEPELVDPADIPTWVLSFVPADWRGESDEPYPGTFTDVPDRWRDHTAFRRWQAARREWLETQSHLRYRDLMYEHRRRGVDHIPQPDARTSRG